MQQDLFTGDDGAEGGGIVEVVRLHEATRSRYLNYALSVITSRALPDVRDGLKPVQRRILYAMYKDLKLRPESRYLKSARVVGDVMGKYHPHGDQSIYDAMVRMAQDFSLRYPLVDGQGNFGSIDGDSAAAMRYTEARLQAMATDLLGEINQNTVDYRPTYDGQLDEPIVLPAQLPNLLINGSTGIAVGMATNIPPHNLGEVVESLLILLDNPQATVDDLLGSGPNGRGIRGPDFPTGGEIISSDGEIRDAYIKGQGPIRARGSYVVEMINRKKHVIITSVPYAINKSTLIEKIASHIESKKLPQVVDIRDESTDDVRIVLELRRGAEPEAAMAYIYKHTPLQQNFNVNLTCLVPTDDPAICQPQRLGLVEILEHFLEFRLQVVTRRLRNQLDKLLKRIHILEGLETIFDALDAIIALIRASEGKADAARKMMARFKLDEVQCEAILELKLYRLAKLEILIIREELAEKRAEAARITGLLDDVDQRWLVVRNELLEIGETYADARRTKIIGPQVQKAFSAENYIVKEKTWVIVTRGGRMKRQKGFSDLSAIRVPDEDEIGWVLRTDTRQTVSFCTQFGSAYTLRVDDIPATTGYGDPVQATFNFKDGERIVGVISSDTKLYRPAAEATLASLTEDDPRPPFAVSASRQGKITRFPIATHSDPSTRGGRKFMSLAAGDEVVLVYPTAGDERVCMATRKARVIVFDINEVPPRSGTVRGVNALRVEKGDEILSFTLANKKREGLVTKTNRGREVIVRETSYRPVKRGGKGTIVLRLGRLVEFEWPPIVMEPYTEEPDEPTPTEGEP
jgi:DNA gyrase subunit A